MTRIKALKVEHNISSFREYKWTKVSPAKIDYYKGIVGAFMATDGLNFRVVIVDKTKCNNNILGRTEEDFYYKTLYLLIRNIVEKRQGKFAVYLDYKDTWSAYRSNELKRYLENTRVFAQRNFGVQPIRSYESSAIQLADLLNGLILYANKSHDIGSSAKRELVDSLGNLLKINLSEDTLYDAEKFNILFWEPYSK